MNKIDAAQPIMIVKISPADIAIPCHAMPSSTKSRAPSVLDQPAWQPRNQIKNRSKKNNDND
jgi:hypothetical protein